MVTDCSTLPLLSQTAFTCRYFPLYLLVQLSHRLSCVACSANLQNPSARARTCVMSLMSVASGVAAAMMIVVAEAQMLNANRTVVVVAVAVVTGGDLVIASLLRTQHKNYCRYL